MSSKSLTSSEVNLLMLVCQEVEPVPVLTHKPEHFVLLIKSEWSSASWRCETLADNASPMNTLIKRKLNAKVLEYIKTKFTYNYLI